jgi:hypothetical protein
MNNILEILIIILSGVGSVAFIIWYFFFASRKHSCKSCGVCKEEIIKDIKAINSAEKDKMNG